MSVQCLTDAVCGWLWFAHRSMCSVLLCHVTTHSDFSSASGNRSWRYASCFIVLCTQKLTCVCVAEKATLLFWITYLTHTHTRLTALCPGLPGWAATRKVKPIWILLKQETVSSSGVSWAICKSAPRCRQITTPAPHRSVFLQAGGLSCPPTNQ